MRWSISALIVWWSVVSTTSAQGLKCDLTQYSASTGLTAAIEQNALVVTWAGQRESEVRARYGLENGQPVIRDLAIRKQGGKWATLGQNLSPEYHVVSGVRRMSSDHIGARVYIGSNDGRFYVLDQATGAKIWEYETGSPLSASPAIAGGRVVIGAQDGHVYCFG